MPYSNDELKANEHYQDLKTRDELKYVKDFSETRQKFLANGGKAHDGLRLADDKFSEASKFLDQRKKVYQSLFEPEEFPAQVTSKVPGPVNV